MLLVECDRIEYPQSVELQQRIVEKKLTSGLDDVLLLLEHPSTVTLGLRGKPSDLLMCTDDLAALGITVHLSDRGGQATYHGPGQLVAYPIVSIKGLGLSVRGYVNALEETILLTLRYFGISGSRENDSAGIWIGPDRKIASIGVKIRRSIAYHGFSLNVSLVEDPSRFVVCCGSAHTRMVSMNQLLAEPLPRDLVKKIVAQSFARVFGVSMAPCSLSDLLRKFQDAGIDEASL